jgi:outer membrane protein TolC
LVEDLFPQLKPILEKALTQSTQMLQRNIDIAQSEVNKLMSDSALLPSVGSSVSYATSTAAVSTNTDISSRASGLYYSVSIGQPVFYWGTIRAQSQIAKIGIEIAEKNFAEAYRLLAVNIRAQYTGLITRKVNLRNSEFGLKLSQSNLAIEEERLRNGRISPGAIILPQLSVEEARLGRDRAAAGLEQGIRAFCQLTGLEKLEVTAIPDELSLGGLYYSADFARPLLARFLNADAANTLQAQIYRDYIQQANLSYKIARFRLYPKIGMSAGYSLSNSTSASQGFVSQAGVTSQAINVTASWTIFDGFATKGSKRSALLTKRTYEQQLESYLRTTADQITDLEHQLEFAARAMKLSDTRRDIQANAVRLVEQDRLHGVGTQITVDSTRAASYQTDLNAYMVRAEFLSRWAEFLSALNLDPALHNIPARFLSHAK